jgi:hypothetical protein
VGLLVTRTAAVAENIGTSSAFELNGRDNSVCDGWGRLHKVAKRKGQQANVVSKRVWGSAGPLRMHGAERPTPVHCCATVDATAPV